MSSSTNHHCFIHPKQYAGYGVYIYDELPQHMLDDLTDLYTNPINHSSYHASAVPIDTSTRNYNCHGYAWYKVEDGTLCWLEEDVVKFWEDSSYVETTQSLAEKIVFDYDNHSVIPTDTKGRYISKWGAGPLMEHDLYDHPFTNGTIKYYKKYVPPPPPVPSISGPSFLCKGSPSTFTAVNPPAGFTWDKSSNLSISGSGAQVSVTGTSAGSGYISVKNAGGTEVARQNVTVAIAPVFDYIDGPDEVKTNVTHYCEAHYTGGTPTEFQWSVSGAPSSYYGMSWTGNVGTYIAKYQHPNSCGQKKI